ncbi:glycoside hydrolase family 3 N-terminal domain-containing protein [Tessaracoccus oleiagri]|uniref:beta-N-acetylhexosaminidase n=1 Tax=Tessaracoccus oleiagri TaxID=686624 RepID=A0A1G9MV85_9ACTN|nr:glycoside hydrolase family 3 N-terminal domain-containing protein [Tessaracoccus oleiagri]SDL78180.1 beta-N-acetylhexosaminidase [Tessaracoccus oleiagri]
MGRPALALAACAVLALSACAPAPLVTRPGLSGGASASAQGAPQQEASTTVASSSPSESSPVDACRAKADGLTAAEQAGQLLMVGVPTGGLDSQTATAIRQSRAGSVVLLGSGDTGVRSAAKVSAAVGALGSSELPMLVAVDQEGGRVQRLQGEGFTRIPTAVEQGELDPAELRAQAETWGDELRRAGVRFNLAPTADVVPEDKVTSNAPIGQLQRHYNTEPAGAARSVVAFVEGMSEAGVATSLKHFPGLGRVEENTDFAAATDTETTVDDPGWAPFVDGIAAGASSVMISSAVFERIDPDYEAVFSHRIITEILRDGLGFDGVVIADDLGAAEAVADTPPGDRAVLFLEAGGDLVINADPSLAPEMAQAIVATMDDDPEFAENVATSVARVLALKESVGSGTCD